MSSRSPVRGGSCSPVSKTVVTYDAEFLVHVSVDVTRMSDKQLASHLNSFVITQNKVVPLSMRHSKLVL